METITKCRSCGSDKLTEMFDLGEQYVSDFREDFSKPPRYPIVAVICEACMLVQLRHTTPQPEMYHDNYGFKSGVSNSIKDDLQDNVEHALSYVPNPVNWLDEGSNDGTLLSYVPDRVEKVGIDPVGFLCEEAQILNPQAKIVNKYFSAGAAQAEVKHKYDVITSISCFYDMPDPNKFVADNAKLLSSKGVWVVQQNYLLPTFKLGAIDNFCHEHLEYYTLLSLEPLLERHGLEVVEVRTSTVNGGSIRTVVAHKGAFSIHESVEKQRAIEADEKLGDINTYMRFAKNAQKNIRELRKLVDKIRSEGKTIAILAASTRGATIWQAASITDKDVLFAVERNPAKVGKMFSAIDVPIVSEEVARKTQPDYMMIGPWFFAEEILQRESVYRDKGGKFILPLPKLKVIG